MSKVIDLSTLRELVRCYQSFERASASHVRTLGLTPAQFDIVATLGNTPGMTFRQLGAKTLITKGTLTGVVDRLADKGLAERCDCPGDGRATIVKLTRAGERLFRTVFESHLAFILPAFEALQEHERGTLTQLLARLRAALDRQCERLGEPASKTGEAPR